MIDLSPLPALLAAADWPRAEALLRRAAKARNAPPPVFYNLGKVLMERGKPGQALTWLRRAVKAAPDYTNAWFELGRVAVDTGDLETGKTSFARALALAPNDQDAARNLLAIAMQCGDWSTAQTALEALPESETRAARYVLTSEAGNGGFDAARAYLDATPGDVKTLTRTGRGVMPFRI